MNDGGGHALASQANEERYRRSLLEIIDKNRANGTITVVCSPGVVDEFSYANPELVAAIANRSGSDSARPASAAENVAAVAYNRVLGRLRDVGARPPNRGKCPLPIFTRRWPM